MIAFFEDSGFILGGYVITFVAIAAFVARMITTGRNLGKQVPDDDKYWT